MPNWDRKHALRAKVEGWGATPALRELRLRLRASVRRWRMNGVSGAWAALLLLHVLLGAGVAEAAGEKVGTLNQNVQAAGYENQTAQMTVRAGGAATATTGDTGAGTTQEERRIFGELSAGARVEPHAEKGKAPSAPTVYLTFDDGPSRLTEAVLDILKREEVPATFFVLGNQMKGREDLILRMRDEGHQIGNHTYNHVYKELYQSYEAFQVQTERTEAALEGVLGYKPSLLRAPGGTYTNFDPFYYYYLEQAGYQVVDWNVDSGDAKRRGVTAEEIVGEIRKSSLKHELVVLLHDGAGHEETVKALPDVIAYYRELGYSFAALDERVPPVQFSLGKSKWSRAYSLESFTSMSRLAVTERTGREASMRLVAQGRMAWEEAGEPPLHIPIAGRDEVRVEPERYSFDHNRFSVPVRQLAEGMGAQVLWHNEERVASIRIGDVQVEIDPDRRIVKKLRLGKPEEIHYMADVSWAGDEISIGLRAGAWLLGGAVADYSLGERIVKMDIEAERQYALLFRPAFLWKIPQGEPTGVHV